VRWRSPVLIDSLVGLFGSVHHGSCMEVLVQTVLLTDAVTNASAWAVASHTTLALKGSLRRMSRPIREGGLPKDGKFAARSLQRHLRTTPPVSRSRPSKRRLRHTPGRVEKPCQGFVDWFG